MGVCYMCAGAHPGAKKQPEYVRSAVSSSAKGRMESLQMIWIDLGEEEEEMLELTELSESSEVDEFPESDSAGELVQDNASRCEDSIGPLPEMHVDSINGCDEIV